MLRQLVIIAVFFLGSANAALAVAAGGTVCQQYEKQLIGAIEKIRNKQTGGFNDPSLRNPAYEDPDVKMAENIVAQARKNDCNFSSALAPKLQRGQGTQVDPRLTPAAPGEVSIAPDPTFNPEFNLGDFIKDLIPVDAAAEVAEAAPPPAVEETPLEGGCGEKAVETLAALKAQTGASRPSYKEGCAGTDVDGIPQASSDAGGTACTGNQIGKFGLIEAVYSNGEQNVDVTSLLGMTPSNVTPVSAIAFKNTHTGSSNEPSGCRLSNYRGCGKAGDIILVQSSPGSSSASGFDTYLVYDGSGNFYEAVNSTSALKSGPLNPLYNSASYAAVRLGCASVTP